MKFPGTAAIVLLTSFAAAGAALGAAAAYMRPRPYVSTAIFRFYETGPNAWTHDPIGDLADWTRTTFSDQFVADLARKYELYPSETVEERVKRTREDIVVKRRVLPRFNGMFIYEIGFECADPVDAEHAADDIVGQVIKANMMNPPKNLALLDLPTLARKRVPDFGTTGLVGAVVGLAVASLVTWGRANS